MCKHNKHQNKLISGEWERGDVLIFSKGHLSHPPCIQLTKILTSEAHIFYQELAFWHFPNILSLIVLRPLDLAPKMISLCFKVCTFIEFPQSLENRGPKGPPLPVIEEPFLLLRAVLFLIPSLLVLVYLTHL